MTDSLPLSHIARVFNGKTPPRGDQRSSGHPVLKIRDIDDEGSFRGSFESFVDAGFADQFAERRVREGDTLILNAAHNADYVGSKLAFAKSDTAGALATGEWLLVRPTRADPRFVHYWLRSSAAAAALRDLVKGIHLYPKDVARLRIPLPDSSEQIRIADILEKADSIRHRRKDAITLTDDLPRSAFLEMFGDPVTNPKRWDVASLGSLADAASGVTKGKRYDGQAMVTLPYMRVANVQDGHLILDEIKTITVSVEDGRRYALQDGDVLLTEGGDPDKLGRGSVWRGQIPDCIHQNHIFRVRPGPLVRSEYLSAIIGSARGKRYFLRAAKQTTGIATINMTQLKAFPVLVPPLSLQDDFSRFIERATSARDVLRKRYDMVGDLFDSLMTRAFAGRLIDTERSC